MNIRIGFGYDVHPLKEDIPFVLGGIEIPHIKGSLGHSDGDVLIHALCDAMLGAANLRDIGIHFPNTSKEYQGIDSKILLKKTLDLISERKYSIINIDSTICLQKPTIKDFIPKMQISLAEILNIDIDRLSIKATTTEKLGFVGREEGVEAYAVVLLNRE
jgi:2-C-methyl-D-erythritol 2,4-cyclodiphosphate synthase